MFEIDKAIALLQVMIAIISKCVITDFVSYTLQF
jgi:hypothetical protein